MGPFDRLLHLGNVVVDVVLDVPGLPERGGDVLASRALLTAGGGFNVMVAAARQGLPVSYAGAHGRGPLAAAARAALAEAGVEVMQQPGAGLDTGFVVSLIEPDGERTFITSPGAEATLSAAGLASVRAAARDAVYLSGYGLMYPSNQRALLGWLATLDEAVVVFFDPGPLAASIPAAALDLVMRRTDWLTCNATEATALAGRADPAEALSALVSGPAAAGDLGGLRPGPAAGRGACWCGWARTAACSASRVPGRYECRASVSTWSTPAGRATRTPERSSPSWPRAAIQPMPHAPRTPPPHCRSPGAGRPPPRPRLSWRRSWPPGPAAVLVRLRIPVSELRAGQRAQEHVGPARRSRGAPQLASPGGGDDPGACARCTAYRGACTRRPGGSSRARCLGHIRSRKRRVARPQQPRRTSCPQRPRYSTRSPT